MLITCPRTSCTPCTRNTLRAPAPATTSLLAKAGGSTDDVGNAEKR